MDYFTPTFSELIITNLIQSQDKKILNFFDQRSRNREKSANRFFLASCVVWFNSICMHNNCLTFKKNSFLAYTVMCRLLYHWMEVSREVHISRVRSANDIFPDD